MRGWIGVDLFFVLSGFLITGILLREKARPGLARTFFRNFYARRFLRIFPLYYAVLAALFVVAPALLPLDLASRQVYDLQGWLWTYCANVETAVHHRFNFDAGWYRLSHLWSLAVEEHFYMLWPAVVWGLSDKKLLRVAIGACVAAPLLRAAAAVEGVFNGTVYVLTIFRVDALAMGAVLAIWHRQPGGLVAVARWTRWVTPGALVFVFGSMLIRLDNWHWSMQTIGYSIVDAGCASLLVSALFEGGWSRLLKTRVLRAFGKYSYGIYLVHWPLQATFCRVFFEPVARAGGDVLGLFVYLLASVGLSLGIAIVVWHAYERPFLRLKRFFEYAPSAPLALRDA